MASMGPTSADITLTVNYGGGASSVTGPMPRADVCKICHRVYADHAEGKCLFESTKFQEEDFYGYHSRFAAWMAGQRLEDCLARIAYELTKAKVGSP
jgi:hypothetical protein